MKSLVTIIVGIYNGERYLAKCIDSIINQTYENIEIILVDDGSTDNSSQICDEYAKADSRIRVIHKKNGGVSSARNSGISIAKGNYFCFVDQDDFLALDYVEYLYNLIINYKADISVVPQVIHFSDENQIYIEKHSSSDIEIWSGEKAACEMMYSKMEIGPWSKMISKKVIADNNMVFNEKYFGGEGYLFSVQAFAYSKKVVVGFKGIYNYRVDNYESEMSKFRIRTLNSSISAVNDMIKEFSPKSNELKRATNYAYWRVYVAFLNSMIGSKSQKKYPDVYKNIVYNCKKYAYVSLLGDVPFKRKVKDLLYFFSPVLVAKLNSKRKKRRKLVQEK